MRTVVEGMHDLHSYARAMTLALEGLDPTTVQEVVDVLYDTYRSNGTVFTMGNGGSASTAEHFAADLSKWATGAELGFRAQCVSSNIAGLTAWVNDSDWSDAYAEMLRPMLGPGDVLVAFSVHGGLAEWSNNLITAFAVASEAGAHAIGISGDGGGMFNKICDINIVVPTPSPELTTPVTESAHVAVAHYLCVDLRQRISPSSAQGN
jgi:D-sedoheptulose 7-phosphate isomerase